MIFWEVQILTILGIRKSQAWFWMRVDREVSSMELTLISWMYDSYYDVSYWMRIRFKDARLYLSIYLSVCLSICIIHIHHYILPRMDANQSCTDSPRCVTAARNPIPKPCRNLPSFDTIDGSETGKSPVDMENLPPLFTSKEIHWMNPEKTWVSNRSIATYSFGSRWDSVPGGKPEPRRHGIVMLFWKEFLRTKMAVI